MKTRTLLLSLLLAFTVAIPLAAQSNAPARGKAEATVKGKAISVSYGRPTLKGRDLLAQAKPGTVWRVGMNEATEITTAGDLVIDGKELKAGKYSLWVRKTGEDTWTLAFHPKTGVWGAPALKEGYAAELPLKLTKADDSAEELMIHVADKDGKGEIQIHWGTALLTGWFDVK
ncbi:MAG TPA: DUF2911 domain-containing protein [Pyrinomonadaceae bacterium]|nr:DUF2911 domain-containing protein [Pyrinomonadaceae bacterium]